MNDGFRALAHHHHHPRITSIVGPFYSEISPPHLVPSIYPRRSRSQLSTDGREGEKFDEFVETLHRSSNESSRASWADKNYLCFVISFSSLYLHPRNASPFFAPLPFLVFSDEDEETGTDAPIHLRIIYQNHSDPRKLVIQFVPYSDCTNDHLILALPFARLKIP